MKKPFEGLLVIELTTYWAATSAGRFLRTQGARVIKVEAPPHGDSVRSFGRTCGTPYTDNENPIHDLSNGGKIQYVKYPVNYNKEAIRSLVRRAMAKGYYEGVNLSLAYCDDCGHEELSMDVCPVCGSTNLTKIDRMNGYLSYSRVKGDTRLNETKMAEIAERKSM